ncbi:MAG TPA: hypothetical protein VHQ23_10955, partial [Ilumatobacteraceae bacterium]|nr:hypothetical protein [Ilumatobacteraceae bacterium]
ALVAACGAGSVLAVDMLSGNNPLVTTASGASGPAVHVIGEDVATSFGVVAVEHATAISGLNDTQVTGAHGVPGLVEAGSIDVQVAAVITNLSNDVLKYQPTQFELIDNTGASVAISRTAELPGELQPYAAIDVLIDFVTTADARPFKVRFTDPSTSETVVISLGDVGCTVQGGTGRPLPVTGGCSEAPKEDHTNHG